MRVIVSLVTLLSAGLVQCDDGPPAEVAASIVDVGTCAEQVPPPPPETCEAWDPLYQCLGASSKEIEALRWVRARESECGTNLVNPRTSDIGDCQLNGVHGRRGWSFGQHWPNGWAVDRFGLRGAGSLAEWRSNVEEPAGVARLAAACLFLLRGTDDGGAGARDAFGGCGNWRHTGWREVCAA